MPGGGARAPVASQVVRSPGRRLRPLACTGDPPRRLLAVAAFAFLSLETDNLAWRHAGAPLAAMEAGGSAFHLPGLLLLSAGMILAPTQASPDVVAPRLGDGRGMALTAAACLAVASLYHEPTGELLRGRGSLPAITPALVSGVVFAPVVEAWIFRGLLWRQIAPDGSSRMASVAALVISSVACGDWHLPFANDAPIAIHAAFGLVVGLLRWRSGSVLPPMALHGPANLLSSVR